YRLVRDAVEVEAVEPLELKGKAERVPAYKLLSVSIDDGVARRLDAPMVGRGHELQLLMEALDRARTNGRPALAAGFRPAGARRGQGRRDCHGNAWLEQATRFGRCADGASPTATASRSGRSPRSPGPPPGSATTTPAGSRIRSSERWPETTRSPSGSARRSD